MSFDALTMTFGPAAIVGLLVALITSLAIVVTRSWHGKLTLDNSDGIQKFHTAPTPRIGGVSLYVGCVAAWPFLSGDAFNIWGVMLVLGFAAFIAGLVEDLTKRVTPRTRLIATIFSGGSLAALTGVAYSLIPNFLFVEPTTSLVVLTGILIGVAVGGLANAMNIIDGFHGLASGSLAIMCGAFAVIAHGANDVDLAAVSATLGVTILGFMVINFPMGKLFLGDGGAYFAGFALAAIAILLPVRNPEISPMVSILVVIYPTYETLFSIIRKSRREGIGPTDPDNLHLHSLIRRSFGRLIAGWGGMPRARNAITGALMWPFSLLAGLMAVVAHGDGVIAFICILIFAALYGRMYRIVSLQRPSFMNPLIQSDAARKFRRGSLEH